jgi:bacteriocin-like protein
MINAINPKNNDENNDENNDVTIVGADFFTDSESFLNELTDDELQQVTGGKANKEAAAIEFHSLLSIWC